MGLPAVEVSLNILEQLRSGTRELHRTIESNPLHRAVVDGSVTRASYRLLLERMHGIHQAFEENAGRREEWRRYRFHFDERRKLPLLDLDLAALGALSAPPAAGLALSGTSFGYLLGYLYVLEGSTLGGQILTRLIQQHLGFTPAYGASYFHAYGQHTGSYWKECCELIAEAGTEESVVGARDAFVRIDSWLRGGSGA